MALGELTEINSPHLPTLKLGTEQLFCVIGKIWGPM